MRRILSSSIILSLVLAGFVPFASAQEYTQCNQLTGNWQHVCNRYETNLDRANAANNTALIQSLNEKRLSLLRRYARAADRSLAKETAALRKAFEAASVMVIDVRNSKPLCDGSLAIVTRTLDKSTCRFSR
ncbi:MAG: hypothetical protein KBD00_05505 [Candidatus Peribacteraceae bacterium]|nr:hypothetical protein [Candidatus Peribacteraceae bacterium]